MPLGVGSVGSEGSFFLSLLYTRAYRVTQHRSQEREPAPTSSASVSHPLFLHITISYRPSVVAVFLLSLWLLALRRCSSEQSSESADSPFGRDNQIVSALFCFTVLSGLLAWLLAVSCEETGSFLRRYCQFPIRLPERNCHCRRQLHVKLSWLSKLSDKKTFFPLFCSRLFVPLSNKLDESTDAREKKKKFSLFSSRLIVPLHT